MSDDSSRLVSAIAWFVRLVLAMAIAALVVPPVAGAVVVGTLMYGPVPAGELPDERPQITAIPSVVVDAQGTQIAQFRGFDRTVDVEPGQIPELVENAIIAIEDRRFWEHNGVDLEGISRAARVNLELGEVAQGGSTITQQYVKNVYLTQERTLERKVEEALLAVELEKRMTKQEILHAYLTTSYFGEGAYGVGAAAEVYFAKSIEDLDISEAATLAGLVQAPTRLSPRQDLDAAEQRRRLVLQSMHAEGYISERDYERELARHLWVSEEGERPSTAVTLVADRPLKGATDHPHFVDWVESELLEELGPDLLYQGGLTIETTIEPEHQRRAEAAVADRLRNTEYPVEMSLVSLEPETGHVLAMVGGRDYDASQVNLAIGGSTGFQPGSSFKPIVMATAFEQGMNPEDRYPAPGSWVVPDCTGQCTISNYDGRSWGDTTIRNSMKYSVNTVYAQMVLDVGIDETVNMARRLGIGLDPDRTYGASLSLGAAESSPLEMATAYGVFANRGVRVDPTGVSRVLDADGNVLIDNRHPAGTKVLDERVADNVTDVLTGVVQGGTGGRAALDRPVAGKTGTAQAYRAAWFVGYTPQIATAVWMGHADHLESLRWVNGVAQVTGGSHPAIAWREYMAFAHEDLEVLSFPEPAAIVTSTERSTAVIGPDGELITDLEDPTTVGGVDAPTQLADNCGGRPCIRVLVPEVPDLAPPENPGTTPVPEETSPDPAALLDDDDPDDPDTPTTPAEPSDATP
ncbi:MAG: PBP1A family penicillin-binding protein [Actinomycetota bacterium]